MQERNLNPSIEVRKIGGITVVEISGEGVQLDSYHGPIVAEAISDMVAEQSGHVVIDASSTDFMDCTGLYSLLHVHEKCPTGQVIVVPPPYFMSALTKAASGKAIPYLAHSEEAAMKALSN